MGPGSAWFLTKEERSYATTRIKIDVARYVQHTYGEDGLEKSNERLTKRDLIETGKDWKLWFVLFFNICASIPGQAFSVFLPLVVKGLGFTSITANLVCVLDLTTISTDSYRCLYHHIYVALWACTFLLLVPTGCKISSNKSELTIHSNSPVEKNAVFIS
jgi:hypothetical protein